MRAAEKWLITGQNLYTAALQQRPHCLVPGGHLHWDQTLYTKTSPLISSINNHSKIQDSGGCESNQHKTLGKSYSLFWSLQTICKCEEAFKMTLSSLTDYLVKIVDNRRRFPIAACASPHSSRLVSSLLTWSSPSAAWLLFLRSIAAKNGSEEAEENDVRARPRTRSLVTATQTCNRCLTMFRMESSKLGLKNNGHFFCPLLWKESWYRTYT